ncbi:HAD family hydrolase [Neobacillus cucumis]|uniref:Sucrose phosphatase-like domain-containing protein n=1 Tax=Neobacillus cucumis TaxID=1740721 RepID=A0A2N5HDC5_9BACI|nr:HAD family hydrolase [Neobacillus cucumis]PLS03522.1 hypothetical protein CVD27_14135 [Neobacillus cucumis]
MIFASDLDRTLIYSERAIKELGKPEGWRLTPVEKKGNNWVAYMTENAYIQLKELSSTSLFIPVTTRTTAQFKRFVIFPEDIRIKYAITSNGANILLQGQPIMEWSNHIQKHLKQESVLQVELLSILYREGIRLAGERKQAEEWFFYYILNCLPSESERKSIEQLASQNGWRISFQGRKLYFVPKAISKGNALDYICKLEGGKAVVGAGDSLLDWDFLKDCHYRFIPNHGELARHLGTVAFEDESSIITKNSGVSAGEEIIQQVCKLLHFNPIY